jgi:hypothetical protein
MRGCEFCAVNARAFVQEVVFLDGHTRPMLLHVAVIFPAPGDRLSWDAYPCRADLDPSDGMPINVVADARAVERAYMRQRTWLGGDRGWLSRN